MSMSHFIVLGLPDFTTMAIACWIRNHRLLVNPLSSLPYPRSRSSHDNYLHRVFKEFAALIGNDALLVLVFLCILGADTFLPAIVSAISLRKLLVAHIITIIVLNPMQEHHALCFLSPFLGVIQLGFRGCACAFGLSIDVFLTTGSLSESSHNEPADITGAAFAFFFFFFFSDPASLSVSEPVSAGAGLFGCLNLQSFPFLQVPFFQNEHKCHRSSPAGELLRLGP